MLKRLTKGMFSKRVPFLQKRRKRLSDKDINKILTLIFKNRKPPALLLLYLKLHSYHLQLNKKTKTKKNFNVFGHQCIIISQQQGNWSTTAITIHVLKDLSWLHRQLKKNAIRSAVTQNTVDHLQLGSEQCVMWRCKAHQFSAVKVIHAVLYPKTQTEKMYLCQ